MSAELGMRTRSGTGINLATLFLKAPGGAMNLTNCRFYDATGTMILSGIAAAAITIPLTTSYQSLKTLVEAQTGGATVWESIKDSLAGFMCDAVSARVDVSLGQAAATVPSFYCAVNRPLTVGSGVPDELKSLSGANVTVSGEVEVAQGWKTWQQSGVFTTTADEGTIIYSNASAYSSLRVMSDAASTNVEVDVSADGIIWSITALGRSNTSAPTVVGTATTLTANAWYSAPTNNAPYVRVRKSSAGGTGGNITAVLSSEPYSVNPSVTAGALLTSLAASVNHDGAASTGTVQVSIEARETEALVSAEGDATRIAGTKAGHVLAWLGAAPGGDNYNWNNSGAALTADGTTDIVAAVSGKRGFVEHITVENYETGSCDVTIEDADGVPVWGPHRLDGDGAVAAMCPHLPKPISPLSGTTRGAVNRALKFKIANKSGTIAVQATVRGFRSAM